MLQLCQFIVIGRLTFQLILELFEFFDLEYSQVVLQSEANLVSEITSIFVSI